MNDHNFYDGKTAYQVLEERGLLNGLTDAAFEQVYNAHREQSKTPQAYSVAEAQVYDYLQKHDVPALINMRRTEPDKFDRWQESYLRHAEYLNGKK